jgi:hypothetical protein
MRFGWIATAAAALTVMLGAAEARADDGGPVPFAAGDRASARLPESLVRGREVSGDRPPGSVPPGARTVPSWSGSFATDGVTYPYTMVGTDPARGSATTVVPVVLIPLRVRFAGDHATLEDPQMVADVTSSPLFVPMPFATGVTQYPDAFQRANLWSQVGPGYHVLLGGPRVLHTLTIDVPSRWGVTDFNTTTNRRVGIVDSAWLDRKLTSLLDELGIRPDTLPVFLAYNVAGTNDDPAACLQPSGCEYFWGYHGAVADGRAPRAVQTFIYSTFIDWGDAIAPQIDAHEYVLSHELIEWIDDPFVLPQRKDGQETLTYNQAPPWTSAFYPACSDALEVADPLEGNAVSATPPGGTEHLLADGAFLSWFARQSPSTSIRGLYDAIGVFDRHSSAC